MVTRGAPSADIHASFAVGSPAGALPESSRFGSLAAAKTWRVDLFVAFHYTEGNDWVDVVRIRRGDWDVHVVADTRGRYAFRRRASPSPMPVSTRSSWWGRVLSLGPARAAAPATLPLVVAAFAE